MIEFTFYKPEHIDTTVEIFEELSQFYLQENASNKDVIRKNLLTNILSEKSGVKLILALSENNAVALATISLMYPAPKETGLLFIKELFVFPRFQRTGVGEKLFKYIAKYAVDNGCSRLDWCADSDNEMAVSFYSKLGFEPLESKLYFRASGKHLQNIAAKT